jgi:hypothetical protein
MCRHEALVRTVVSEEHIASIIRVKIISDLGATLAVTSNPDDGGDTFLRNVSSYKSHTASHHIPENGIFVD